MKFWNSRNAFVPVGPRDSVPPLSVTRDFTQAEQEENHELRDKIERGILIPWDGKSPLPSSARHINAPAPKPKGRPEYTIAPDSIGGERKTVKAGEKTVEYIVADTEGADDVQNAAADPEIMAALPEEGRPLDFIEEGVSGREVVGGRPQMKTQWRSASDMYEEELKKETTEDVEFDDSGVLTEGDDHDRVDAVDVDSGIDDNYTQVLQNNGTMGASVTTTAQLASDASAQATAAMTAAVQPDVDDGEVVPGASGEVADFLKQPFFSKKWLVAKSTDVAFLTTVNKATRSENLKSIISQRLTELETK